MGVPGVGTVGLVAGHGTALLRRHALVGEARYEALPEAVERVFTELVAIGQRARPATRQQQSPGKGTRATGILRKVTSTTTVTGFDLPLP